MEQITGPRLPITQRVYLEGPLAALSGHISASFYTGDRSSCCSEMIMSGEKPSTHACKPCAAHAPECANVSRPLGPTSAAPSALL